MEKVVLGETGLEVSVMGVGCGGHSKMGLGHGKSEENAIAVIRRALELGVTLIDSSEAYKNEHVVGNAIKGQREQIVLATKLIPHVDGRIKTPQEVETSLENSLRKLQTDRIDLYQVHGPLETMYPDVVERIYPTLDKMRQQGKIRFLGVTEMFTKNLTHQMLSLAVQDDLWDTIMVGFNILNQSARTFVLPEARKKNMGVLCMFAVRRGLTSKEAAQELILELLNNGELSAEELDSQNPLGFLLDGEASIPLIEAAYRFCRYEPGIDCVLSGTGSLEHLESNAKALQKPPLPADLHEKLKTIFGHLTTVSAN